jgi:hypothetical protein
LEIFQAAFGGHGRADPELDLQSYQPLLGSIMQIPLELASRLILYNGDTPTRFAHLLHAGPEGLRQLKITNGQTETRCDLIEQAAIGGREGLPGRDGQSDLAEESSIMSDGGGLPRVANR